MPTEAVVTLLIIIVPTTLILLTRVPSFAVLFSLLIGYVLSSQASGDIYSFLASLSGFASYEQVQAIILLLPFVLTMIFLKGRVHRTLFIIELVPAIFSSLVLLILVYPYSDFIKNLVDISSSDKIDEYRSAILVTASILGLVSLWINLPKMHLHKKRGKHKH